MQGLTNVIKDSDSFLSFVPPSLVWLHPQVGCKMVAVVLGVYLILSQLHLEAQEKLFWEPSGERKLFLEAPSLTRFFSLLATL